MIFKMHQAIGGRQNIKSLDVISRYFSYVNLVKDDYIEYLKLTIPLFTDLEPLKKQQIFELISELYFGDSNKKKSIDTKVVMKDIEKAIKRIKTYGAAEITGPTAESELSKLKNATK